MHFSRWHNLEVHPHPHHSFQSLQVSLWFPHACPHSWNIISPGPSHVPREMPPISGRANEINGCIVFWMSVGKHQDWQTDGIPQRRCRWNSQPRREVLQCLSGKANVSFQYNFHCFSYFQTMKISSRVWDLLQIIS